MELFLLGSASKPGVLLSTCFFEWPYYQTFVKVLRGGLPWNEFSLGISGGCLSSFVLLSGGLPPLQPPPERCGTQPRRPCLVARAHRVSAVVFSCGWCCCCSARVHGQLSVWPMFSGRIARLAVQNGVCPILPFQKHTLFRPRTRHVTRRWRTESKVCSGVANTHVVLARIPTSIFVPLSSFELTILPETNRWHFSLMGTHGPF